MRERTYWFTYKQPNGNMVWAGRKSQQRFVDENGVGFSFFPECYNTLHNYDGLSSCYMKHKTYKSACAQAGIRPVRIKWGNAT